MRRLPFSRMITFLFVIHTYYFVELFFLDPILKDLLFRWPSCLAVIGTLLYSYLTFFTLYYLIDSLVSKTRWLRVFANIIFLLLYALATAYFFGTHQSAEYALIVETIQDGFTLGLVEVLAHWLDPTPLIIALIACIVFIVYEIKTQVLTRYKYGPQSKYLCISLATLYLLMILSPLETKDEMTFFMKSIHNYYFKSSYRNIQVPPDSYPLTQHSFTYNQPIPFKEKPHVFLIIIESFDQWATQHQTSEGKPLMPFFNTLKNKGLYVENFYAHSVLSIKGYGAIFGGILPAMKGIVLRSDLELQGLPTVFENNGYQSQVFYSSMPSNFKQTLQKLGTSKVFELKDYVTPEDKPFSRSTWGYEDHILYKHFFTQLDKNHKKKPSQIYFNTLITLYNHCGFDVPKERRFQIAEPKNIKERFMNSIYLSDQSLSYFFDELKKRDYLKNSIVIITGDHGYPVGNHGITRTETGIYEESYRVPFLMIWEGHITPKTIPPKEGIFAHRNIAPTLVDLLHLNVTSHHFTADSIFSKNKPAPVLLVQPYSGIYLQSIRYPYKYIKHLRSNLELLLSLETDPLENENLIHTLPKDVDLNVFREDIKDFYLNQYLIEHNQIFKP